MNQNRTRFAACLTAVCLMAGTAGCAPKAAETAAQEKSIYVETVTAETGDLSLSTEFIGTVEPDELVSVFPKVAGTVLAVHKNVGDEVKKGELLFEVDPSDIQLSVNIAQAQLMSAQAQMDQALGSSFDMQMIQLESQLKQAQNAYSNARQSLRDYNDGTEDSMDDISNGMAAFQQSMQSLKQQIAEKDAAIKQAQEAGDPDEVARLLAQKQGLEASYDQAEAQYLMMRANYNDLDDGDDAQHKQLRTAVRNAQTAYESAEQIYELTKDAVHNDAIKVAKASLGQATAAFEAQAKQLEYTRVTSPIDGVIEQKNVSEQGLVSQSSPAYTVSNKSTLMVTFYVPADAVDQMAAGDKVTIENGRRTYEGTIAEVGTMVDPATGLFTVKASADEDDGALLTGLSVKVTADTAKARGSLLIPQSVVYYEDGAAYVYLLENGRAVKTFIETGISNEESVEVTSGLTAASRIISTWHPNLTDGAAVVPAAEAEAASSGSASEEASSGEDAAEEASSAKAASEGQQAEPDDDASDAASGGAQED